MALGAELFAMTGLAKLAGRCGGGAVGAQPIAFVGEMTLRQHGGVEQVAMTRAALPRIVGSLVVVAVKTGRHCGTQMIVTLGDADVAAHAIALCWSGVSGVGKYQVLARFDQLGNRVGGNVTGQTRRWIVGLYVARDAGRGIRQM